MRLHQIKKLLHSKENNYQNKEIIHRTGENLGNILMGQRINIQIYKELKN
jgi:hypothetical protein